MTTVRRLLTARAAMLAALGIMCLNYAGTSRWAHVPGSLHGSREPIFLGTLAITIVLALLRWPRDRAPLGVFASIFAGSAIALLIILFFVWFPPETWTEIPFQDNWPARYLSTIQGIELLKRGAFTGWQWSYLGGYHLSSDITQSLSVMAFLPVLVLGAAPGFHALHLLLFLALPALMFCDLAAEDRETRRVATGLTALTAAGFAYLLLRSGDTNSLAGVVCTMMTLVASRLAAGGARWAAWLLLASLVLLNYVHAGFLLYAVVFLVLEAAFYRDRRRLMRALVAAACAFVAGLPAYWESWRYPAFFIPNNVMFDPHAPFMWMPFLRRVYYNVELLWLPGRWVNDFTGLAAISLPITLYVAWRVRTRAGLYAWIALVTTALMRINTPEFAYLFLRPLHVLAVCMGPVLAVFLSRFVPRRSLAVAFVALVAAYLQILVFHVPHIRTLRDADPALVERITGVGGALVLVENTPHRDMDADPEQVTQPTPFNAHIEQVLAPATGRRLYAGLWDGWQWSPYRDQLLAGGAFRGHAVSHVPIDVFTAELRKWGIRHLIVWTDASLEYLRSHPHLFAERWHSGRWYDYEYADADARSVVVSSGSGALTAFDPLSATIDLSGVATGADVVVRTNYYPAWTARVADDGTPVPLVDASGQLAFRAPRGGSFRVELTYPRRVWLTVLAGLAMIVGGVALAATSRLTSVADE